MTIPVAIEPIAYADKTVLRRLMQLYLYDFTEFEPEEIRLNVHGEYEYRYLDHYWAADVDEARYPFFIRANGELAGFALVRQVNDVSIMAEFFVMRPYRHGGVGAAAAKAVFAQFPGAWLVHEVPRNLPAQAFWRRVTGEVAHGAVAESVDADGVTQRFRTT